DLRQELTQAESRIFDASCTRGQDERHDDDRHQDGLLHRAARSTRFRDTVEIATIPWRSPHRLRRPGRTPKSGRFPPMRCLILAAGRFGESLRKDIENGREPRLDVFEIARELDAEVLDFDAVSRSQSPAVRLAARYGNNSAALAVLGFEQ